MPEAISKNPARRGEEKTKRKKLGEGKTREKGTKEGETNKDMLAKDDSSESQNFDWQLQGEWKQTPSGKRTLDIWKRIVDQNEPESERSPPKESLRICVLNQTDACNNDLDPTGNCKPTTNDEQPMSEDDQHDEEARIPEIMFHWMRQQTMNAEEMTNQQNFESKEMKEVALELSRILDRQFTRCVEAMRSSEKWTTATLDLLALYHISDPGWQMGAPLWGPGQGLMRSQIRKAVKRIREQGCYKLTVEEDPEMVITVPDCDQCTRTEPSLVDQQQPLVFSKDKEDSFDSSTRTRPVIEDPDKPKGKRARECEKRDPMGIKKPRADTRTEAKRNPGWSHRNQRPGYPAYWCL